MDNLTVGKSTSTVMFGDFFLPVNTLIGKYFAQENYIWG
jgi:hypothetical protein